MKFLLLAGMSLTLAVTGTAHASEAGADAGSVAKVQMQAVKFSGWERVLSQLRGNIIVVDLWASWCAPCIERFPHMVDLYHEYRDKGVRFISLNFDERGDTASLDWANRFLGRVGAVFPNYQMDENMTDAFERLDLLGLPVVLIYDAAGAEAYRLTGDDPNDQFDQQDVEEALRALVR